ncbi:DEAD/DEAH box helicase [Lactococcus lactis]|jgi:competence protein ComFA|uniref:DEAD/DEAH box helicase n=1 Tax=Lactococcus lactis TaxID=1358 RepID=UPI00071D4A0C|nr:DEAD/DEAH box helicase [Lactococcus lactis]KSU16956.1 ComF operon protein A DNA transporter ATPase [Lactococcus lactis subsp. lactis]MCT0053254.1 DNA/RNA helicase [Lactococcus lactis subsp. lactis]
MSTNQEKLFGRLLLKNDILQLIKSTDKISVSKIFSNFLLEAKVNPILGMTSISSNKIKCNRCGTVHIKNSVKLPIGVLYCPSCIQLGRVRSDEFLYFLPQKNFPKKSYINWSGKLIENQKSISNALCQEINSHQQIIVQAVTGAGKTEMIYQVIEQILESGGVVGLASPRIDVCLELHQRLSRDFSCKIPLLYHDGDNYFRAPLIIMTSHQLLRFKEAFDLLIIDEVDAFPFRDNEMLYFAAEKARKIEGNLIYLTATSTDKLEKDIKKQKLYPLFLPRRFHNFPLVVPKFFWKNKFDKKLIEQRNSGFPLLIFAAEIEFGQEFAKQLQLKFPKEKITSVASTTKDRLEIVKAFRNKEITILIATSILERGVTFPNVDVFVINSEHPNFTKSALIQMAGRVGRSSERPTGLVSFFHYGKSKAMCQAVREIKKMNQLGGFS